MVAPANARGGGKDLFSGMVVDEALEIDDIEFLLNHGGGGGGGGNQAFGPTTSSPQPRPPVQNRDGYQYMVV